MTTITGNIKTGRKTVGLATVQLTTDGSLTTEKGIQIYADISNSGIVYVGNSDVTANSSDTTDGFPLDPGNSFLVPIRHPYRLHLVSNVTNSKVWWMTL